MTRFESDLATADSPPPVLPGEHFAAALLFLALGAIGLVAVAPELAASAFYAPRVVAVAHLFTLGFVVMSIFGALSQFLPVAVSTPLRWQGLAHVSFAALVLGVLGFVCSFLHDSHALRLAGASALSLAFTLFALNLGATLLRAKKRGVTWWALAGAAVFMLVTPAYGVTLASSLHDGRLGALRFETIAVHAHIALLGVVLLVLIGVSQRLLPMFLLSHGAGDRAAWLAVILLGTCSALLALPLHSTALHAVAAALACAGVLAYLAQAVAFFRHRLRPALDPGLQLTVAGLCGLGVATLLAPFALRAGLAALPLLVAYYVMLLGAFTVIVSGHYYKIVPFLVWYHRFGPLVGAYKVPKVADLFSAPAARTSGALLVSGWLGLALASYAQSPAFVRLAALALAGGALLQVTLIARIARRRPT